jgi:uncharacterized membrane protein YfcA
MLESVPVTLFVGAALGFLAGLGVGGGSLLMLWLTLILNMEHPIARSINLIFFLPTAIVSSFFRWRQGTLDFKKVLPAILVGCASAAAFALLSRNMDVSILKKLFGGLLIVTGLRELLYRPRKAK